MESRWKVNLSRLILPLAAVVLLIAPQYPASADFEMSEVIRLNEEGGARMDADIDPNGDLHIVAIQGSSIRYVKALLSQWSGQGPIPKVEMPYYVPEAAAAWKWSPARVAGDSNGDAHITWGFSGKENYYKRTYNGEWGPTETTYRITHSGHEPIIEPNITVSHNNTPYIAIRHVKEYSPGSEGNWIDVLWKDQAGIWQRDYWVSGEGQAYSPDIECGHDGRIHVIWEVYGGIGYSILTGRDWEWITDNMCDEGIYGVFPGMSVDADGNVHVAYQRMGDNWEKDSVWYAMADEEDTLACEPLTFDVGPHSSSVTIAVNDYGDMAAIWRDNDPIHYAIKERDSDEWIVEWLPPPTWCCGEDIPNAVTDGKDIYFVWSDIAGGLSLIKIEFEEPPMAPKVMFGGWVEEDLIPGLGGSGILTGYVSDPNGLHNVSNVYAYDMDDLNFQNGIRMYDDGLHDDMLANDGFYAAEINLRPGMTNHYMIIATDDELNMGVWPSLHIIENSIFPEFDPIEDPNDDHSSISIPFAGYMDTELSRTVGGYFCMAAYVVDPYGIGVKNFELLFNGEPQMILAPQNEIDPNFYMMEYHFGPNELSSLTHDMIMELRVKDMQNRYSQIWPYYSVPSMKPLTPTPTPTHEPTDTPTPTPTFTPNTPYPFPTNTPTPNSK